MYLARTVFAWGCLVCSAVLEGGETVRLDGRVLDADSGRPVAARIYLRDGAGTWHFVQPAVEAGSVVPYDKRRGESVEVHTTVSAHPFQADLPKGEYVLRVERGKEYRPHEQVLRLRENQEVTVRLDRWIDMSREGWFSGETHVHRALDELPQVMLAEDLNVAFPLSYWVTVSDTPPSRGERAAGAPAEVIRVDDRHVIYPRNTEYEIFRVGDRRHTLGAIFALNHRSVLPMGVPPVGPVARRVRAEGGLLELDKHNWPWSMMLVPVMEVDLYELTNNHIWRTDFYFRQFGVPPARYMQVATDERGMTERGWLQFTLENYYALLNCGFRLRPTAGTASGVHPVPLGFGRVYVHLPDGFSYGKWVEGLDAGRSFVTTGPMMSVQLDERPPGTTFEIDRPRTFQMTGWIRSPHPLTRVELVAAGKVLRQLPTGEPGDVVSVAIEETIEVESSTWLALRCFAETPAGRVRFAHSAPMHIDLAGRPLRPRREQVEYLVERVEAEIERNREVLGPEALREYEQARERYGALLPTATED